MTFTLATRFNGTTESQQPTAGWFDLTLPAGYTGGDLTIHVTAHLTAAEDAVFKSGVAALGVQVNGGVATSPPLDPTGYSLLPGTEVVYYGVIDPAQVTPKPAYGVVAQGLTTSPVTYDLTVPHLNQAIYYNTDGSTSVQGGTVVLNGSVVPGGVSGNGYFRPLEHLYDEGALVPSFMGVGSFDPAYNVPAGSRALGVGSRLSIYLWTFASHNGGTAQGLISAISVSVPGAADIPIDLATILTGNGTVAPGSDRNPQHLVNTTVVPIGRIQDYYLIAPAPPAVVRRPASVSINYQRVRV